MPKLMRTRYLLGFGAATVILVLVGLSIMIATQRFRADSSWVNHTHAVIGRLAQIRAELLDGISSQRSYLLTGDPAYLAEYRDARPTLRGDLARLAAMTTDSQARSAQVDTLGRMIELRLDSADNGVRVYREQGLPATQALLRGGQGHELTQRIGTLMTRMETEERGLLDARRQASQRSADILLALGALGIPCSLAIVLAIYMLLSREVRERERAERSANASNDDLARSVSDLRIVSADLTRLGRYAGHLQGCRSVPEALDVTRRELSALLPECAGTLYLLRASMDYAEAETSWGEPVIGHKSLLMPDECWALRRGKPHLVDDIHAGMACAHVEAPAHGGPATSACLPLAAQNLNLGFLCLSRPGTGPVERIDIAILAAEQLSLALGNLRLQESLRQQSIRDALSGLYNRRYLEESLARELSRCQRRGLPLALLMLDIDHFKAFNDVHGHDGGDALLAAFGKLMQTHCRHEDIACRYGGEEFTLILPETDLATAVQRAGKIRVAVEAMQLNYLQRAIGGVTVSIGVAMFPQHAASGEQLKRLADTALYRGKHAGRNRVEVAEPEPIGGA